MESFSGPAQVEERSYWWSVAYGVFDAQQIQEIYDRIGEDPISLLEDISTPETLAYERVSLPFLSWDATAERAYESISHEWHCFVENHEVPHLDAIYSGYQLSTPHECRCFVEKHEVPQLDTYRFKCQLLLDLLESLVQQYVRFFLVQQYLRRISVLLSLLRGRTQGIKYKRPKHVICAAMPWTILPCLIILWGVCWMFYNPSQASSPALGFEFQDYLDQFDGGFDQYQNSDFGLLDHNVGLFGNSIDLLAPAASGAPIGTFSVSEVQVQAEPEQPTPGLQQQLADMPSSQPDQPLALEILSEVPAQTPQAEQARNPICCTEPGCGSKLGTERDLQRHKDTVHGPSKFPCPIIGCNRGIQKPCNRLDNLKRHMRNAHGQSEQTPTAAPRNMAMRGQKRRAETSPESGSSPESRRRKTENEQGSRELGPYPLPASGHAQDEVVRLQEQLAEARRREDVHVARTKALEKEVEANAAKLEALKKDNEVQDAYIRLLGRKG